MRTMRMGGGGLRALTALLVASLTTASALHLFFADAKAPDSGVKAPEAGVQELFAGAPAADTDGEFPETAEPASPSIVIRLEIERTAPVAAYLAKAGLSVGQARFWKAYFRRVARTSLLRKGHSLTLYRDAETGELRGLRYDIDERTQVFEAALGSGVVKAFSDAIQYAVRPVSVAFAVRRNFRKTAERHHLPQPIVEMLEEAFSSRYHLDRLSPGSAVKVIYDERVSRDGAYRMPGEVKAAEVQCGAGALRAFAFRDEHGRAHLYDESGRALGPQFLRFPVNFRYISSGFSLHRYHPILHAYRPHVGVDLVARYGMPVKAIADGRVAVAGWCGELGNCVRLEHDNRLSSIYGHLARVSPTAPSGSYVRMGQTIGWVGSTGLSTGPHLHFALERRGTYVNPLTEKLGVNHEISPRMRALFERLKERYRLALAKLPDLGSGLTASEGRAEPQQSPAPSSYHETPKRGSHMRVRFRSRRRRTIGAAGSGEAGADAM